MTDTTNPPIQVLGETDVTCVSLDFTVYEGQEVILRDPNDGYLNMVPKEPDGNYEHLMRRKGLAGFMQVHSWFPDPYVALGWVTYDDDGVPIGHGPLSAVTDYALDIAEELFAEKIADQATYKDHVLVRRDSVDVLLIAVDDAVDRIPYHPLHLALINFRTANKAALERTTAGDKKENGE